MFKRKESQRFSLRKYKVGVASVFLGLGISLVGTSGEVKAAEETTVTEVAASASTLEESSAPTATTESAVEAPKAEVVAKDADSLVNPALTSVKDVANLTADEKAKVVEAIKAANAKVTAVEVANNGVATITFADGSKATLAAAQTVVAEPKVEEKTEAKVEDKTSDAATGKKTVGYKANPVETPTSASMPRRAGYVGTEGSDLRAGEDRATVTVANKNDKNDPMPGDDQLTDTTKFGKGNDPDLEGFVPKYESTFKEGNTLTPAQLTGDNAPFNETDPNKRVAQVWALRDPAGNNNAAYYAFVYDLKKQLYEIKYYNSAKELIDSGVVNKTNGERKRFSVAGNTNGSIEEQVFVELSYINNGYQAVYNGTDGDTSQGRPADKSDVRRVYSALAGTIIPESYSRVLGRYTQQVQSLPSGAEMNVNYLEVGTKIQMRDSDHFVGFVGDKYTTTAATDSEFYAELQNKGYELVKSPKYPSGQVNGTYWGGKGFVAVRDVSNQGGHDIRVRMTVVSDAGDVVFEAWNKTDKTKLPIRYYKYETNPRQGSPVDDQMVGNTLKEFNYVSDPIKPALGSPGSEATWGSLAFRIYVKEGMWINSNFNLSEADRQKAGLGFDSGWSNGWRPAMADATYWYERPKGNVKVEYYIVGTDDKIRNDVQVYDNDGEPIKETYKTSTGSSADGQELRPETITYNGKTYELVKDSGTPRLKNGSADETGTVEKVEKVVKYQYQEVVAKTGSVDVKHIAEDGTVLEDTTDVQKDQPAGTKYETAAKEFTGYTFSRMGTLSAPATGEVEAETTKHVVYVYKKNPEVQKGSVDVVYVDEQGNVLEPKSDVQKDQPAGTAYTTEQKSFDGYTFTRMGEGSANASGEVIANQTQHVIYVYKKNPEVQKGSVDVKHVATDGTELKAVTDVQKDQPAGTAYTTSEETFAGYRFVGMDKASAPANGSVIANTTQHVIYLYEKVVTPAVEKGNVDVTYVTEDGKVLEGPTAVATNEDAGTAYTTTQKTFDGYDYVRMGTGSAEANGNVIANTTQHVVYVYKAKPVVEKGSVDVVHVAEDGTVLKAVADVQKDQPAGTAYTTSQETFAGYTFQRMGEGSAQPNGEVIANQTQHVIYVYRKNPETPVAKKGDVDVKYITTDGKELEGVSPVKSQAPVGEEYTTSEKAFPGYRFVGMDKASAPANGKVTEDTQHVIYVYEKVEEAVKQQADITIVAVDEKGNALTKGRKTGKTPEAITDGVLETSKVVEGEAGKSVQEKAVESGFNYAGLVKKYQTLGYKVVPGGYTGTGSIANKGTMTAYDGTQLFDDVKDNVQHFVIKLTPIIVPVTPEQPVTPGGKVPNVPTDPNNPNPVPPTYPTPENPKNPNDPNPTDSKSMTGTRERVVEYYVVDENGQNEQPASSENPAITNKADTLNFRKEGKINLVTGEVTYPTDWTAVNGTKFDNYVSPEWTGYTVNKVVAGEHTGITAPGDRIVDKVVYRPVSKPTPPPVVNNDTARVIYQHTDKAGNVVFSELERTSIFVGEGGKDVDYSTAETIKKYQKLGFEVVSNGFDPNGTKPKYDGQPGTDDFYVKLTPIIVPITPEKPLVPGKEIPELPETPKYPDPKDPDGKTKEDLYKLTEEVTRTVTYYALDKDGNNPTAIAKSEIPTKSDTLNFRREGSINLVTGETTLGDWKLVEAGKDYTAKGEETGSFKDYTNPLKEGYLLVKEEVAGVVSEDATAIKETGAHTGVKATDKNIEDKVYYRPIAKYVPKFPPGETPEKPWTDVPYTNDPKDPSKITPPTDPKQPPIPYVPGMEPKDPGSGEPLKPVDPTDPTKGYEPPKPTTPFEDTPIPYEVVKGSVVVRHVIEGTEIDLKDPETIKNNVKVGEKYTTAGETEITGKDGKTYVLVGLRATSDAAEGEVTKGTKTVVYEYKLKETPVVKDDKAVIIFRHVNADGTVVVSELERTSEFSGKEGTAIQYTAAQKQAVIDKYREAGYRVVADQYGSGKNYDGKDGVDTYYIDLTPYIVPVTPDKPVTPGGEVPTDPNSPKTPDPQDPKFPNPDEPTHPKDPKYPNPKDPEILKLTEEVNRTITYYAIINGVKTPIENVIPTQKDTVNFQRKGTINLVTGDTTLENWNPQTGRFETVVPQETVVIDGVTYRKTIVQVDGEMVNPTDADKFYEVIYTPVVKPTPTPDPKPTPDPDPKPTPDPDPKPTPDPEPNKPTPPTPPVTPGEPGQPTPPPVTPEKPEEPGQPTPASKVEQPKLPNTGVESASTTAAGLGLFGLVGLMFSRRKQNK